MKKSVASQCVRTHCEIVKWRFEKIGNLTVKTVTFSRREERRDERHRWGSRRARETLVKAPLIIATRSRVYQAVYKYDRWPRGNTSPWISRCNLCVGSESETGRENDEKRLRERFANQFGSVLDGNDLTRLCEFHGYFQEWSRADRAKTAGEKRIEDHRPDLIFHLGSVISSPEVATTRSKNRSMFRKRYPGRSTNVGIAFLSADF